MYREHLIPCCPRGTPRLLDKDELAMENQQGAEGPEAEQTEHSAGGQNKAEVVISWASDFKMMHNHSGILLCHRSRRYL